MSSERRTETMEETSSIMCELAQDVIAPAAECDYCSGTGVCPSCGGADIYHDDVCVCMFGENKGVCPVCFGTRERPDDATRAARVAEIEFQMNEHDKRCDEEERERDEELGRFCQTCGDRAPWSSCPYRLRRNGGYKPGECPQLTGVY